MKLLGRIKDITGQKFNRLIAINYVRQEKTKHINRAIWKFKCDCGNYTDKPRIDVEKGKIKSCGCLHKEKSSINGKANKKENKYTLDNNKGMGITSNTNKEFYFDLEDYELIKDYCWNEDSNGYVATVITNNGKSKSLRLHKLITKYYTNMNNIVDHEDRNKMNNCKSNLRFCNHSQNNSNINLRKDNTSGIIGVHWRKKESAWYAQINVNMKNHYLGMYSNINDAIIVRLKAEKKYFKEFAPQQHLYKIYGLEEGC